MKLVIALVALQAALPAAVPALQPAPTLPPPTVTDMPNAFTQAPNCLPIIRQIQEQAKRTRDTEYRTLDREPPAHLLLAVDRQVNGCREAAFLRRDAGPGARPLERPAR